MFSDFEKHDRLKLKSNMILSVSSTFYIRAMFTGNYDKGCGFEFNVMDANNDYLLHLDVQLNNKNRYRKLIQASKLDGKWGYFREEVSTDLPDLAKENEIYVLVTEKYYVVTINKIEITEKFEVDLERLQSYWGIAIQHFGECIRVDLNNSYMANAGLYNSLYNSLLAKARSILSKSSMLITFSRFVPRSLPSRLYDHYRLQPCVKYSTNPIYSM